MFYSLLKYSPLTTIHAFSVVCFKKKNFLNLFLTNFKLAQQCTAKYYIEIVQKGSIPGDSINQTK